jgi:hypothetical protein
MKITLSKSQWEEAGKKAGWISSISKTKATKKLFNGRNEEVSIENIKREVLVQGIVHSEDGRFSIAKEEDGSFTINDEKSVYSFEFDPQDIDKAVARFRRIVHL